MSKGGGRVLGVFTERGYNEKSDEETRLLAVLMVLLVGVVRSGWGDIYGLRERERRMTLCMCA